MVRESGWKKWKTRRDERRGASAGRAAAASAAGRAGTPPTLEGQLTLPGADSHQRSREKLRQQFREGKLDDRQVEIDVRDRGTPQFGIISNQTLRTWR